MKENYWVLGISAFYHDSAAALICNGEILAAAEEERFTRIKGDASFPVNAIQFCMNLYGLNPKDIDSVVYYENPAEKFERIVTSLSITVPKCFAQFSAVIPEWISEKLWIEKKILKVFDKKKKSIDFSSHHISHAASAFYPSPFNDAAIITIDGVGEWSSATYGYGEGNSIKLIQCQRYPNSLGILYSAFTLYTGFKINNGEYKMMGLAPYGKPIYSELIKREIVHIGEDGSIVINQKYFSYTYSLHTFNKNFEKLFSNKPRNPKDTITPFYADIAASIQSVTNEILLKMAKYVRKVTGKNNLVMSGGVALNVTATGLLRSSNIFDNIWIQPASGDSGGALGAALYTYYNKTKAERLVTGTDLMKGAFLGYKIGNESKADDCALKALGARWETYNKSVLVDKVAALLAEGKIVGIAREKAEFGPRALGNRSILADPRSGEMLQRLNLKIKFREGFRPFAPAVIEEDAKDYFEIDGDSPYMTFSFPVKKSRCKPIQFADDIMQTASLVRSDIPAVTHIDYSARIQTVNKETAAFFHSVLKRFKQLTGYSVLINTSFNTKDEPIVNTAVDAYKCFCECDMDAVVIGNRLIVKGD